MRLLVPLSPLFVAASMLPQVATAQDQSGIPPADEVREDPLAGTAYDGDFLTVGIGAGYGPSYEGSDDYRFFPVPAIAGSISGITIQPRAGGIAADFIPDADDSNIGFVFGPVAVVNLNRTNNIDDSVVEALGELDTAIEIGATAGVQFSGVLNPFDTLSVSADVRWDVAGAHDGRVIAPGVSYFTPVSRAAAVSLSISAEHVDDDYADYYYSVTPAGSLASGLPVFRADGGFKSVGATLGAGYDLDGNLANGGFAIFALGGYTRLLGDAKDTPITSIRGDADQWLIGAGVGYTF